MSPTAQPDPASQPDTLLSASLLATTGGLLDAVVYTLHGHVFANAMTGNVILLGITALSRDWTQAARHIAPITAFILGVAASRYLRLLPQFYASLAVLALEMVVLFAAGLLKPSFPEVAFTAIIAFTSAFQVSTFRLVGRFAYNSTFITGNLRTAAESLVNQHLDTDPEQRRHAAAQSRKLFIICGFFLAGALLGAWTAPHLGATAPSGSPNPSCSAPSPGPCTSAPAPPFRPPNERRAGKRIPRPIRLSFPLLLSFPKGICVLTTPES